MEELLLAVPVRRLDRFASALPEAAQGHRPHSPAHRQTLGAVVEQDPGNEARPFGACRRSLVAQRGRCQQGPTSSRSNTPVVGRPSPQRLRGGGRAQHAGILGRILAWQQVVYAEQALPVWLRESLVNNLHLIAEDGLWAQARPPIGEWCRPEDGLFGMNECPRGCPQIECIPCSFYGNMPLAVPTEQRRQEARARSAPVHPWRSVTWSPGALPG